VSVSALTGRLTADAYLARDDPRRTELVDGEVVVHEPGILHQVVCKLVLDALSAWARGPSGRGTVMLPINVPLDTGNVLAPDVLWFDGDLPLTAVNAPRAPELAVEVRSPGTWRYDLGRKRELYERHGVAELWLVDPFSRSILAFRRAARSAPFATPVELQADESIASPLLPGFSAAVGELIPAVQ
jgi:Uma2 family endonuclease